MRPDNHLEEWMRGKHVWLADHYSVPAETLCLKRAPSPNADHFCRRQVNHPGRCQFSFSSNVRDTSWKGAA